MAAAMSAATMVAVAGTFARAAIATVVAGVATTADARDGAVFLSPAGGDARVATAAAAGEPQNPRGV